MKRPIHWFVHNPVAANLLMMFFLAGGVIAIYGIYQEEFPSIQIDVVQVTVEYRGAAPEETEQGVCIRIEEAVEGAPGVNRIRSVSVEGACVVSIEIATGFDPNVVQVEIKNRVDGLSTLPAESEKPVVKVLTEVSDVLQVAVAGEVDERTLRVLGQQVRDGIAALPGVSQVQLEFSRPYEISVEVSEETLRRHGITFDEVAEAVRRRSFDLPGGSVKTRAGEILLRTQGQAYTGREFEDLVVLSRSDGTLLRLGDMAVVRDGFQDSELYALLDGRPAVMVTVLRVGEEDAIEIAAAVRAYLGEKERQLPEGVFFATFNDEAAALQLRLSTLVGNAQSGMLLVLMALGFLLRFRLAMWVAAGVPIAFMGAFMMFPVFDLSLSTLSVMAFILVIGIVVDDAIVIGESVYTRERAGEPQIEAAVSGTVAVSVPVIFGVATTMAAFLPLILVPGSIGKFFAVIGLTAVLCLLFSLIESQLILPAHLAHRRTSSSTGTPNRLVAFWQRLQGTLGDGLERIGQVQYGTLVKRAVEWRYVTLAVALGLIMISVALFGSGRLRYQFFPPVEGDTIYATLTMPPGAPLAETEAGVAQLHEAAERLRVELAEMHGGRDVVLYTLVTVGGAQKRDGPQLPGEAGSSDIAEASLYLLPDKERDVESAWVVSRWRELTGPIPGAQQINFTADAFGAGKAIDVELRGNSIQALEAASAELREILGGYAGVSDISDSFRSGKREIKLSLRPEARPLGITLRDLAQQVRQAFYGEEIQRVQRGPDDIRVMLRYPEGERRTLGSLEDMRIRTAAGVDAPFASIAHAEHGHGYSSINRTNRLRTANVTAAVDRSIVTPESVLADIERKMPAVLAQYPGVTFSFEGEQSQEDEAILGLIKGAALALLLIYALLAIPLRSYLQPLIIMSVIPFGLVGALFGHLILGWDVVFFSILGIVALSGVVVNASLVLVHYVNARRAEGASVIQAVHDAGGARFRPIVLTSVTTFIGLAPLMFLESIQTRMMVPMAISLAFGVLFSAAVTLLLVPSLYVVLEDLHDLAARRRHAPEETAPQAAAAG